MVPVYDRFVDAQVIIWTVKSHVDAKMNCKERTAGSIHQLLSPNKCC